MTTIYIVTSGEYSDYGIDGIFSTKSKAETFIEECKKQTYLKSDYEAEEWELDDKTESTVATSWDAVLDIATGDIERREARIEFVAKNKRVSKVLVPDYVSQAHPKGSIIVQSFVSLEHAVKLCVEKQQELLRKENG